MKMKRNAPRPIVLRGFALVVVLGAAWQAQAQDAKAPYPSITPSEPIPDGAKCRASALRSR
jgi:hypothetical protein